MSLAIYNAPIITDKTARARGFYTDPVTTTVLELILRPIDEDDEDSSSDFITVLQDNVSKKIYFNFRRNNGGFWNLKEMDAEDVTPRQLMNFFYGVNGTFTGSGFLKSNKALKIQAEFDEPLSELLAKGIYPRFVVKMESIH